MTKPPAPFSWLPARHRVGKVVIALGVAVISFQFPAEANLLVNPSFESGNTGFTSDYTYFAPGSPSFAECVCKDNGLRALYFLQAQHAC